MDDPHRIPAPGERRRFPPPWPEAPGRRARPLLAFPDDLRALARLVIALAWILALASRFIAVRAFAADRAGLARGFRKGLARDLLRILGVRLRVSGPRPRAPGLLVANHLSWLDGLVLEAVAAPVAVTLRRALPGYAALARGVGLVPIERSDPAGLPAAIEGLAEALARGEDAAFFPEGTTGFGLRTAPFRAPLFEAAARAAVPVIPASIAYGVAPPRPSPERLVHWVDWTPLLVHAFRALGAPGIEARFRFGPALPPPSSRKAARDAAEAAVAALLADNPPVARAPGL